MTLEEIQQFVRLQDEHDDKLYGWLRQLILLGTGALTVLVSFQPASPSSGMANLFLKGAWVTLGLGILLAALRLYGEVWKAEKKKEQKAKTIEARRLTGGDAESVVHSWSYPWYIYQAEKACYISFALAIICLVTFAVLRT